MGMNGETLFQQREQGSGPLTLAGVRVEMGHLGASPSGWGEPGHRWEPGRQDPVPTAQGDLAVPAPRPRPIHAGKTAAVARGTDQPSEPEPALQAGSSCPRDRLWMRTVGDDLQGGGEAWLPLSAGLAALSWSPSRPSRSALVVGFLSCPFPLALGSRLSSTPRMVLIKSFRPLLGGREQSLWGGSPDPG